MATYIQVINSVLKRLREATVLSVTTNDYSALVGEWVNDAKREIEDAWDWQVLRQEITVTTAPNIVDYTLIGTNERTRIKAQVNKGDQSFLFPILSNDYLYITKLSTTQASSAIYFRVRGWDAVGQLKVQVYPTPDVADPLIFECVIPQAELTSDSTSIIIPSWLVVQRALADALDERGDDGGTTIETRMAKFTLDLQTAISQDSGRAYSENDWIVV